MSDTIILSDGVRELDLTDGVTYHGPVAGTLDRSTAGHLKWTVLITGGDGNGRARAAADIQRHLNRAAAAAALGRTATAYLNRGTDRAAVYDLSGGAIGFVKLEADGATEQYTLDLRVSERTRSPMVPVTVPASLTGSDMTLIAKGIEGDDAALVHLELVPSVPLTRVHWARTPAGLSLAGTSAYTPWVDLDAIDPADAVTDASALGGGYVARDLTGLDWVTLARAEQPAGLFQRGRMDGFLRVAGTGTPLAPPAHLDATVQDATYGTTAAGSSQATTPAAPGVYSGTAITGVGSGSLARTGAPAGGGTATAGGTLFIVAMTDSAAAWTVAPSGNDASGNPLTFTPIIARTDGTVYLRGWIVRNASGTTPITVTVSGGFAGSPTTTAYLSELLHLGNNPQQTDIDYVFEQAKPALSVTTTDSAAQVVVVMGVARNGTVTSYGGGITALGGGAWRQVVGIDQSVSAKLVLASGDWTGFATSWSVPTTQTSTGVITYDEPTPGELPIGTYTFRVQTRDQAGYRSNATSSVAKTTTVKRSSITPTWDAVAYASAYIVTIQADIPGLPTRYYETEVEETSFTLTTLDGLGESPSGSLPSLTGALAPPPLVEVRIGLASDATLQPVGTLVTRGDGLFWLEPAFGNRMLPPVSPMLTEWPSYATEVAICSANGAPATVKLDALWIVPVGTYAMLELWGDMTPSTDRWVIETHRSGRDIIGWREDVATGAERGKLRGHGVPLLPPVSSAAFLACETATGHSFAVTLTPTLAVMPRQQLEAAA